MARREAAALPESVQLTSVGSTWDVVVPAGVATTDGARHTIVETDPLWAHSSVVTDGDALRAMRAALERRALPCRSLAELARASVVAGGIHAVERAMGRMPDTPPWVLPR
jgi:hypothetical protein